jgi:competence protein ComEC
MQKKCRSLEASEEFLRVVVVMNAIFALAARLRPTVRALSVEACAAIGFGLSRKPAAVWAALGAAFVFHAQGQLGMSPGFMIAAAVLCSASGTAALALPGRVGRGGLSQALLALSLGLAMGWAALQAEAATRLPAELSRFEVVSVEGMIVSDGHRTSSGNTIMVLGASSAELKSDGVEMRLEWPRGKGRILLVAGKNASPVSDKADSSGFSAGRRLHIQRPVLLDPGQALFYAAARDLRPGEFASLIAKARAKAVRTLADRIEAVAGKAFPLSQALLLGIKDEIDPEAYRLFREAGCSHVLALSGQHLSILCALMSLIFGRLLKRNDFADAASFAVAVIFTWIAGAGPSLLRAAIMVTAGIAARRLDRPQEGIATLSLVYLVALVWKPADARSLSFTLSYTAMIGLILLAPRWNSLLWRLPGFLSAPLSASLGAVCLTALITLGSFGSFETGGIVASTLSGPLVLAFVWSLLASSLLGTFLPFLNTVFAFINETFESAILAIMRIGSLFPTVTPATPGGMHATALAIVAISLFVYASPYVEHGAERIRRAWRGA